MGLYIKLLHRIFPPNGRSLALSRLHYAKLALEYLEKNGIFSPKKVQLWINATSQLLGGRLDREYEYTERDAIDGFLDMRFDVNDQYNYKWYNSIIIITGIWNIFNEKYLGYVSVNNNKPWRTAYQDIEIDAYGPREKTDLIDLLLEDEQFISIIDDFIKHIVQDRGTGIGTVREIYVSHGPPKFGVVEDLVAIHASNWQRIVTLFYDQMRNEKDDWYQTQVAPIQPKFFQEQLTSEEGIEQLFNEFSEESHITQFEGGSVTYIAQSSDAFTKFYNKFKAEVFSKAAEKLPHADEYKFKMFSGIGRDILQKRQSKIDEDQPR